MAKLAQIGRKKYVSQSALADVIRDIKENGLPSGSSRSSIKRAREKELQEFSNSYGSLIKFIRFDCVDGSTLELPFVHPWAFLQHCLLERSAFIRYWSDYLSGLGSSPDAPFDLILYNDEVTPGNQLRHDQTRKVQVMYWALKQGPGHGVDQLWFTLGLARSSVVATIRGGMSAYVRKAVELFFAPVDARLGFHLEVGGQVVLKFARLTMYIADEAGLKETFGFKGASGIHPCPLCTNVVAESSQLHLHQDGLQPSTSTEMNLWKPASNELIFAKLRRLTSEHGRVTKQAFEDLEKSLGWLHNPHGLLGDGRQNPLGIEPISILHYDYMHTIFVHGVFNLEASQLLSSFKLAGISQKDLHDFLQTCEWPSHVTSHAATGKAIFRKKQEGNTIKCSASEGLNLFSVLRAFVFLKMAELRHQKESVDSYLALCEVIDVLLAVRQGTHTADQLARAIEKYVKKHQAAFGTSVWVPKYHYLQHLPSQIMKQKVVIGCFVHERKHRVAKKFAENMRRVSADFDISVLKDVVNCNLQDLDSKEMDQLHVGLVNPVPAQPHVAMTLQTHTGVAGEVTLARKAFFAMGRSAAVDDFVMICERNSRKVGQVLFFSSIGGLNFVLVSCWQPEGRNEFKRTDQQDAFPLNAIQECVIYKPLTVNRVFIVPSSLWL